MGAVEKIEDDIRTILKTKRVRVTEFFKDFDRLRSGFITASQFKRCLDQCLGLRLTSDEVNSLTDKYSLRADDMVNYRAFCDIIDKNFLTDQLAGHPESQTVPVLEYLGTEKTHLPFGPDVMEKVNSILCKIENYYTYHGVNIRTCYEDFDRHHNGLVTSSQFARRFPGPPDVSEEDIWLLSRYYQDPTKPGLTNYLNFHHDVEQLKRVASLDKIVLGGSSRPDAESPQYLDAIIASNPDLKAIFDKIRIAVYKNGIRTTEFFKDHDKLRSKIITRNQFICGLSLGCGKQANLTAAEIEKLADLYQTPDGRVEYKPFCDIMENAFNVPGLEKHPTVHPVVPPSGSLARTLANITGDDRERLIQILSNVSEVVRKRRLLLYPFFKDYDRGTAYTRNVTKSQFARVLHTVSLSLNEEDVKLLCKKFEEPISGDVNYPAFCQAVDQEFDHYTIDAPAPIPSTEYVPPPLLQPLDCSHVNMGEVISRIKHHVLVNRIRVGEFFEDYDPLRCGSISKAVFVRGLNLMGVTWLDKFQTHLLLQCYTDQKKPDCILWMNFMIDIESVFTQPDLEKNPTKKIPPLETFVLPKEGAHVKWLSAPSELKSVLEEVMARMRSKATQRRLLAKPVFQDFDMHNNGHITKSQFRQCLATLELSADELETSAIEIKFCDNIGFDYIRFLQELMSKPVAVPKYKEHLAELQAVNSNKKPVEIDALVDLNAIMTKIMSIVSKQRMRLYEFMKDYDKLKSGRISTTNFERALDLAGLQLKESEAKILIDAFSSLGHPGFVEYYAFCDAVESIFTVKHLEKNPLCTPRQFVPPIEWEQNTLTPEEEIVYNKSMTRVAEHVHKTRTQLFPLFEDYDKVHNGSVSRSQFQRVLSELEISSLLNAQEFHVIFTKFNVRIGGKNDVNYIPFCDQIYELAKFDAFKP